MPDPRIAIDDLPEQTTPELTNLLIVQDSGVTKKITFSNVLTGLTSPALEAHITATHDAHPATAISATVSGTGVDDNDVQGQLGQLATRTTSALSTATTAATGISDHLADTVDAHDASAISALTDPTLSGVSVQSQLTSAGVLLEAIEGGVEGPPGPPGPGVPTGGAAGQVLAKNSSANYDTQWVAQTGGSGGGGGPLTDADYGDIQVSGSGTSMMIDSTVITTAARTVLDDTSITAMRTTLGAQAADSDLTAIANNTTDGLLVRTGTGAATGRTIQGTGSRIVVTDGAGITGDPTIDVGPNVYVATGTDVPVVDGGTGRSTSTTAYGLIAAGTTPTNPQQTVAPGTSGHLLVSGGGLTLPSFRQGTKSDVGLSNVDNTADAAKPLFTSIAAGIVPASGGGSVNFLRADGTFAAPPGGGGGGIAGITVMEDGTALDTDIVTLDFRPGFDLTETPENEVNISLDLTEYTGGALPVASGGTGATAGPAALTALGAQPADPDLQALADNSTAGLLTRTGAGTAAARTITGTTNRITVANGSGVSANPALDIGSDVVTLTDTQTLSNKTIPQSNIVNLTTDLGARVPTSRQILTTAPLTGGGTLAADRTLDISVFSQTVKGAVPPPVTIPSGRVLKDDGTWVALTGGARLTQIYTIPAPLATGTGVTEFILTMPGDIVNAWASLTAVHTGASVLVDVNINGTTIFTTQSNRPTIVAGERRDTTATPTAADADFVAGDRITVDVDQVGTHGAADQLTIGVEYIYD